MNLFSRLSILPILVCVCPGLFLQTSLSQPVQSRSRVIARVLSTDPFIIEIIKDPTSGVLHNPRPVIRNIKHLPEEIKQLTYGDIISARVYPYWYDAGELALGSGFKNIRKLSKQTQSKYDRKGFLFHYARVTNNPNSYLTIYRDGTVLCQDTPGNEIPNKVLSSRELKKLIFEFTSAGIDRLPSETKLKEFDPALISSYGGKYQQLDLTNPAPNLKQFLARLDSLIEGYIDSATYRVSYYRRFLIKDWPYASIVALDEIVDTFGTDYRYKHRDRLSQIKPSTSLMAETAETCKDSCVLYCYKDKLYGINFGSCSNGTTGTWACFLVVQLSFGKIDSTTNWGYIDWPAELGLRLSAVPREGLDIPAREYLKHKEFYTRLLYGSRFMYKDGNYIYQTVSTRYR